MFIKVHIFAKRALSSSLSQYSAARPASERYRATAHVGYSCPALASASNDQAAMSVLERMENYSENLTLVTRRDRAWVCPSIQMQTTLLQRRGAVSNIASKYPGPETRAMRPARKRSDRTYPGERAGKRLLQPLFCGGQEGWRTPLDSRSIDRGGVPLGLVTSRLTHQLEAGEQCARACRL